MHRAGATFSRHNHSHSAPSVPTIATPSVPANESQTPPKWFLERPNHPKHLDLTQSTISKEIRDWDKTSLAGATIAGNYICGAVIGRGSFGTIRIGQAQGEKVQHVAIKLEKLDKFGNSPCLDKEFKFLRRLQRASSGIPVILALTTFGPFRALVMQLLGPNLQELFERCGKMFTIHCVSLIALQLLDRFEYLHKERILYRDVKGENFLIGFPGSRGQNTIHVVDFGLARDWSKNPYERRTPAGTPRYMSLRTHMGKQPSYRDDFESLSFLFIYFAKGKLPWQGIQDGSTVKRIKRIGTKKGSVAPEVLCEGLPPGFCKFLKAARALPFESPGDCNAYRAIFRSILKERSGGGLGPIKTFDWLEQNVNLEFGFVKCKEKKVDVPQGDGQQVGAVPRRMLGGADAGDDQRKDSGCGLPPVILARPGNNFSTTTVVTKDQPCKAPVEPAKKISPWGCLAFFRNLLISDREPPQTE